MCVKTFYVYNTAKHMTCIYTYASILLRLNQINTARVLRLEAIEVAINIPTHTVYSHCIERMLLIMKEEDGSSLRRTHPHITRSVKRGLVVIVVSPACALSLASVVSKLIRTLNTTDELFSSLRHVRGRSSVRGCLADAISKHYKHGIIFGTSYVVAV